MPKKTTSKEDTKKIKTSVAKKSAVVSTKPKVAKKVASEKTKGKGVLKTQKVQAIALKPADLPAGSAANNPEKLKQDDVGSELFGSLEEINNPQDKASIYR